MVSGKGSGMNYKQGAPRVENPPPSAALPPMSNKLSASGSEAPVPVSGVCIIVALGGWETGFPPTEKRRQTPQEDCIEAARVTLRGQEGEGFSGSGGGRLQVCQEPLGGGRPVEPRGLDPRIARGVARVRDSLRKRGERQRARES
jgi:hypothetical protein